jgi:hypothetical protein
MQRARIMVCDAAAGGDGHSVPRLALRSMSTRPDAITQQQT